MAWETRERGGRYYTRSRREGGRIVREYLGAGIAGELASEADRMERDLREAEEARQKGELEHLEGLAAPVLEVSEAAEVLARAHLIAAGFHKRRGEYRRVRG